MATAHDEYLVGVPTLVTNLFERVRALNAGLKGRALLSLDQLMAADAAFTELVDDVGFLCGDVGGGDPVLNDALERLEEELLDAKESIDRITVEPRMIEATTMRLARLLGVHPGDGTTGTLAAVWLEHEPHNGSLYRIILRQHLVCGTLTPTAVVRLPFWMLHWCGMLRQGVFDPLVDMPSEGDSVETLTTALAIWEPYDEGPLGSFSEALLAARRL